MKIVIIIKSRVKSAAAAVVGCIKYLYDSTVLSDNSTLCD